MSPALIAISTATTGLIRALVSGLLLALAAPAGAGEHFVILLYHHVDADTPGLTSVTPERFAAHLDWLEANDFRVWPLERALEVLHGPDSLPENVVAITFDDAYASVFETAWPMLRRRGMPFAVFVNSDAVDAGHRPYMDWAQLAELAGAGVTLGNHSASHAHLPRLAARSGPTAWRRAVAEDLDRAQRRIEAETGVRPKLFAWPYGEDAPELYDVVEQRFDFALAQRSGAVGVDTETMALPRFPMARGQDDLDRLALASNARALPVQDARTTPPRQRGAVADPRRLVIELAGSGGFAPAGIGCFSARGAALDVTFQAPRRLEVGLDGIGRPGRNKVNCTVAAGDGSGDFYWYAFQWLQPDAQGDWPEG